MEIVDEEYIEEVKDKSENENTKERTEYWRNVFKKWENERNFQANFILSKNTFGFSSITQKTYSTLENLNKLFCNVA